MKTAIELAARLSARYLDTKQMLPDELAHESAAMILQQAEQIEALTKMLVISDDTHQTWMKENSPGGWIDDLRKENKALLKANLDCIDHFNALKADYDALKAALNDAATSLNTISRLAGNEFYVGEDGERVETYMKHPDQIRGYASSRYGAAIDAMKGAT